MGQLLYCMHTNCHCNIAIAVGGLKGDVQVLSGRVKGKTLLPLPPEAERSSIVGVDDILDVE